MCTIKDSVWPRAAHRVRFRRRKGELEDAINGPFMCVFRGTSSAADGKLGRTKVLAARNAGRRRPLLSPPPNLLLLLSTRSTASLFYSSLDSSRGLNPALPGLHYQKNTYSSSSSSFSFSVAEQTHATCTPIQSPLSLLSDRSIYIRIHTSINCFR